MSRDVGRTHGDRKERDSPRRAIRRWLCGQARTVRTEDSLAEGFQRGDARREDRRLRVCGVGQHGLRSFEAELRERETEDAVRFLEDLARAPRGVRELAAHADDLRTLSGEDERDCAHRRSC